MQMECTRAGAREPREGIERRAKAEAAPFETTRPMWVKKVYPAVRRVGAQRAIEFIGQRVYWAKPSLSPH